MVAVTARSTTGAWLGQKHRPSLRDDPGAAGIFERVPGLVATSPSVTMSA